MIKNKFKMTVIIEVNHGFKDVLKLNKKRYSRTWPKEKFIEFDKKLSANILKSDIKNVETFNFLNKCELKYIKDGFKDFELEDIAKSLTVLFEDDFVKIDHVLLNVNVVFEFPNITNDKKEITHVEEITIPLKIRSVVNLIHNEHILKSDKKLVKKYDLKNKLKPKPATDRLIIVKSKK